MNSIESLNKKIARCKKCPRLAEYIRDVAKNKVRRFKEEKYYGKPLSGFGDVHAKLLIVGLAPAAHGGNRTGRMFTGDSSGDWVAKVMHKHGFASIPTSQNKNDGLVLKNAIHYCCNTMCTTSKQAYKRRNGYLFWVFRAGKTHFEKILQRFYVLEKLHMIQHVSCTR